MMNMMDRMVEGRAHRREIDMLLEPTQVFFIQSLDTIHVILFTANK